MRDLAAAASLSTPSDPPTYAACLVPSIEAFLRACDKDKWTNTTLVLRILRSNDKNELSKKPFRFVERRTFPQYIDLWKKLILYLVRSFPHAEGHNLTLSPVQLTLVTRIQAVLTAVNSHRNATSTVNALEPLVSELSLALLEQPLTKSIWASPLIHFMGALGYNPQTGTWRGAFDYRPSLSRAIYLMRIIGLKQGHSSR